MEGSDSSLLRDFSELPDVVWVRVLGYLPVNDRSKVSRTCRTLNSVFNHPSLWYTQKLTFIGETDNFARKAQKLLSFENQLELTKRFGKYFQSLAIKVVGHFRDIPDDLKEILEEISIRCRLENLTIDAGTVTSQFHRRYGFPPENSAVKVLASFVQNAYRMKHLHIRSWPMFDSTDTQECNIFKVLVLNEKLRKTLETLDLFFLEEQEWSERRPILYSGEPATVIDLFKNFKNLTAIGLRTPMVTKELLQLLASPDRVRLQLLKIVVHYLEPGGRHGLSNLFRIPRIPSSAWMDLMKRNPDFRVECTIFLATPDFELANMLTPEVPLSALSFMKYSKIDPQTLAKMATHYTGTLQKFHSFCDSSNFDYELQQLVRKCTNLVDFVYHGEIRSEAVVELAKIRGEAWKRFEVREEKIVVPGPYDDVDENNVLAPGPDGQLVLVALMKFHQQEELRDEGIQSVISQVTASLGNPWKPVKQT